MTFTCKPIESACHVVGGEAPLVGVSRDSVLDNRVCLLSRGDYLRTLRCSLVARDAFEG